MTRVEFEKRFNENLHFYTVLFVIIRESVQLQCVSQTRTTTNHRIKSNHIDTKPMGK